jgi:hypothetical protein
VGWGSSRAPLPQARGFFSNTVKNGSVRKISIFTRGFLKLRENRGVLSDSARPLTEDSRHPRVELVNKAGPFEVPDVDGARKSLDTWERSRG